MSKLQDVLDFYGTELISFKKFLERVPVAEAKTKLMQYNQLVRDPVYPIDDNEEVATYERKAILLLDGDLTLICKAMLVTQLSSHMLYNDKVDALAEKMIIEHLEHFGNPKYLVRVAPRWWFVANPDDFRIFKKDNNVGLACFAKERSPIFNVYSMTEEEIMAKVKSLSDAICGN